MIAIDTNVLLRRLLLDDPAQAAKAQRLFERSEHVLITDVVLVETIWVLRGKRYGATRDDIARVVASLIEEPNVVFEDANAIWSAYSDFVDAGPETALDFSDALIASKAEAVAASRGEPFKGTYSFDRAAQKRPGILPP